MAVVVLDAVDDDIIEIELSTSCVARILEVRDRRAEMALGGDADRELLRGSDEGLQAQRLSGGEEVAPPANTTAADGEVEDVDALTLREGDGIGFVATVLADGEGDAFPDFGLSGYIRRRTLDQHGFDPRETLDGGNAFLPGEAAVKGRAR